jgi:hypothetical protein
MHAELAELRKKVGDLEASLEHERAAASSALATVVYTRTQPHTKAQSCTLQYDATQFLKEIQDIDTRHFENML